MRVYISLDSDNDVFAGEFARDEVARILRDLAERMADGSEAIGRLYDFNGNRVGHWEVVK